nr:PEPxxWA-CTERM sorting domain-containing protein [uncultured Sphingomonas sp.]
MRAMFGILAACLVGMASPASAQLLQLNLTGTLQVSKTTLTCGAVSASGGCMGVATQTQTYEDEFMQLVLSRPLEQGDNPFSYGSLRGSEGLWSGIINNNNGVLTGRELTYLFERGGVRTQTIGSYLINANARTFAVTAVPEPATWALMLLGFLTVGTVLRRAPRRTLRPA